VRVIRSKLIGSKFPQVLERTRKPSAPKAIVPVISKGPGYLQTRHSQLSTLPGGLGSTGGTGSDPAGIHRLQQHPATTGESYRPGTTIPVRGDFNTLDNPFQYTSDPTTDQYSKKPAAGLHFLMFQPTVEIFNSVRLAMDGHFPGMTLPVSPLSAHAGINSVLQTTHRQNYLVPPRRHRSFPLAEFLN
jgi:hypothetical protein